MVRILYVDARADPPFESTTLLALSLVVAAILYVLTKSSNTKHQLLVTAAATTTVSPAHAKPSAQHRIHSLASRLPILGDLLEFLRNVDRLHEWMADVSLAFNGEPWHIRIPGLKDMVVITSPALVEEVLATQFANFERGAQQIDILTDILGTSIITSDGDAWLHQRKVASKFFTARALRVCMATTIRKNLGHVYAVIDASMDTTTTTKEPVDLGKLFHDFALQTFAEAGLGVDLDLIGNCAPHPLDAMNATSPIAIRRMQVPMLYWKLQRWLNVGPERTIATAMKSVRAWLDTVVAQSLEAAAQRQAAKIESAEKIQDKEIKSVVELFLEQSAEDKHGLRAEDLVDFILTFMLAARNTSAVALTWIFLMVAKHPLVEKRLRDEMAKELSDVALGTYLTTDHVAKLVYLDATIKEVLRLYPIVPVMRKEAAQDTVIGGDLFIKKGKIIALPTFAQARMPSVWGPDAAEIKPERWIDETTGELLTASSSKFTAFGAGPRICIGMKLAMLELRVVMANLLNRYQFTLAVPNDCRHVVAVELQLAAPVLMRATRVVPHAMAA